MAKFNLAYVKKNPVMFGAIIIVFGLLFWLLMSGRGGASGSTTVVSSGPSEAFKAQAMQVSAGLQSQQIQAGVANNRAALELEALTRNLDSQENLAVMEMQYRVAELETTRAITSEQTAATLAALQTQMSYSLAQTESNNQAMIDYASVAADSATTQLAINAALQRDLSSHQLSAYKYGVDASIAQGILSTIPSLKKKDRDTALGAFIAGASGSSYRGGGGDDVIAFSAGGGFLPSSNDGAMINDSYYGAS